MLPLLLAGFLLLLLQVSESSRSSPPVVHRAAARRDLLDANDGATPASSGATPWGDEREGAVRSLPPRQTSGGRALVREGPRPTALLRSKLARRFLAEAGTDEAGTDGAGLSCHSNSVHINCPPASKP